MGMLSGRKAYWQEYWRERPHRDTEEELHWSVRWDHIDGGLAVCPMWTWRDWRKVEIAGKLFSPTSYPVIREEDAICTFEMCKVTLRAGRYRYTLTCGKLTNNTLSTYTPVLWLVWVNSNFKESELYISQFFVCKYMADTNAFNVGTDAGRTSGDVILHLYYFIFICIFVRLL